VLRKCENNWICCDERLDAGAHNLFKLEVWESANTLFESTQGPEISLGLQSTVSNQCIEVGRRGIQYLESTVSNQRLSTVDS
ncbi:hypothetical protein BS17DRAFT_779820, partial [Gyrodon lividus]